MNNPYYIHDVKNPLGICDDHMKAWQRVDCPLCDCLFLYDRLKLAVEVINDAIGLLSEMPEIKPGVDDLDKDEENRGKACKILAVFSEYAKVGVSSETCSCDEVGESRCPKHGFDILMGQLRSAKKGKGA